MMPRLYKSIIDNAEGYVVEILFELLFNRDSILPPFTSRTMRSILFKATCLRDVASLYVKSKSHKPVTLRVLRADGRPLYKLYSKSGSESKPYIVKAGNKLQGALAFYKKTLDNTIYEVFACDDDVDIGYAEIHVQAVKLNIYNIKEFSLDIDSSYKVSFITPLLITTKTMTPPTIRNLRLWRIIKESRQAYRLFPTPGYILSQAMRQWLALVQGIEPSKFWYPYSIGRLGDVLAAETDYQLTPVTAFYRRGEKGLVLVRGVRGYVIYTLLNEALRDAVDKLLSFASIMGLGKSRSIGFGEIAVKPLNQDSG